jgi:aspartyl-tRNA(Asn)/glutamyl-tRNA(Gln) amidotransferase subunit A
MTHTSRRAFFLLPALAPALLAQGSDDPALLGLAEAAARIRSGALTPTRLLEACLARVDLYQPKLNAFITVTRDLARAHARQLDTEQKAGKLRGPLHGIPIALKDNIDTQGIRTTAASAAFDDRLPQQDAEVARRLKEAGAVMIGKTNLHEFAAGGTNATSYFGPVRNPWALERNPGGSSGGSGASVAAGLCFGALGTDTGGSVRIPAAFCGITGLKPTYGLVSIRGIIPLTFTLDHCGPMTRSAEDAAIMLNAMAGYDRLDIASVEHPREDYIAALRQSVRGLRLGIPREPFFDHVDADIAKAVEDAIAVLAKLTAGVRDCTLPPTSEGFRLGAEMYAWHEENVKGGSGRYQLPLRRSMDGSSKLLAYQYVQSRWRLELLRRTIDDSFRDVDVVALPTRRRSPRLIDDARKRERSDKPRDPELENTSQFNFYGIPAVSIPCGFTSTGLPIGLTLAGPRFSEGRLLALAHAYQQQTDFHKRRPPLKPDMKVPELAAEETA